jgi:hypothetical protein
MSDKLQFVNYSFLLQSIQKGVIDKLKVCRTSNPPYFVRNCRTCAPLYAK